ncbi:MAG: OmpA family protein [Myxococcota bacterium]
MSELVQTTSGSLARRTVSGVIGLALGCALAASVPAAAQTAGPPYSIDVEFLRPAFGHQGFAGVDAPIANRNLTLRYGAVLQYESAPLTLYEAIAQQELGPVVTNRFSGLLGASLDVNRVTFSVLLPTAANWGTKQPAFGADGFGLGDAGASARLIVLQTPNDVFNVGARVGIVLPTGRKNAYIGEDRIRFGFGAQAALSGGPFTLASDLGLATRSTVETSEDFVASNEVTWGNALRYRLPDATRVGLSGQVLTRAGMSDFLRGGAENAIEALGGVEVYPTRSATFTLNAGRGLTEGYGTTDFRVMTGLVIEMPPPEPPRPRYTQVEPPRPPPPPPPEIIIEDEPEVVFEEGQLAVKVRDAIYIKDMIEFVVDTNILQEYSKPTLTAVAKIINEDPYLAHVVIEGHASQEGSYEHNYTLAESRSRRIWEFFMEQGVAKDRISYRGMGEVEPVVENGMAILGEDEASLQKNRRVRFLVVKQFEGEDQLPDYPDTQILPWNGSVVPVIEPPKPQPAPEPTGPKLDEYGMPIDDDEDAGAPPAPTTPGK